MTCFRFASVWSIATCASRWFARRMSHVTRHTSHVTRHTSHVARRTSHLAPHTSHLTPHASSFTHTTPRSHGVSVKMIIEAFNPSLPPLLRLFFKPTASIPAPPHTPLTARPSTAAAAAAAAAAAPLSSSDVLQRPFTSQVRPNTSYSDAGDV